MGISMPVHDHQCTECGYIFEEVVKWDEYIKKCPKCDGPAKRVYLTFNGIKKEDPNWLNDTLEVVDKDGGAHCQEFLKHPTRSTYKNWMKGEGLRPFEKGESTKFKKKDTSDIRKQVMDKFKRDNTITIT